MKALILRGKHAGKVVSISQWCNDWFSIDSNDVELATKPFSPASLAFRKQDMELIKAHKNNGTLFEEFEVVPLKKPYAAPLAKYALTFRKPKPVKREYLTPEQAWECVDKSAKTEVHVFHNPAFGLLGFDVSIDRIKVALGQAKSIEIGGEACLKMGHGIVVIPKGAKFQSDIWFIKHDEKALKKYTKRI